MGGKAAWRRVGGAALRAVAGILVTLVTLAALALAWLNLPSGEAFLRSRIERAARNEVPGFSLGALDGPVPFSLTLRDLRVEDRAGAPVLAVQRIEIDPRWRSLLEHRVELALVVRGLALRVVQQEDGALNLSDVLAKDSRDEEPSGDGGSLPGGWSLAFAPIALEDARLTYVRPDGTLAARQLELEARARLDSSGELSASLAALRAKLEGAAQKLGVAAEGRLSRTRAPGAEAFAWNGRLALQLHEPRRDASSSLALTVAGTLPRLEGQLRLTHPAGGAVLARGWVRLARGDAQLAYELTTELRHLDPQMLLGTLPRGDLNATIALDGEGVPLVTDAGRTRLRVSFQPSVLRGLELEDAHLAVRARGKQWELQRLDLRAFGARLWGAAQGSSEAATGELHAASIDGMVARLPGRLEARGRVDLAVRSTLSAGTPYPRSLALSARAALPELTRGSLRVRGADLALASRVEDLYGSASPARGSLTLRARPFVVNDVPVRRLRVAAESDGEQLKVRALLVPKTPRGERLPALRAQATLPLSAGEGGLPTLGSGPASGRVQLRSLPVAPLARWLDVPSAQGGELDVRAKLDGSLDAPRINLALRGRDVQLEGVRRLGFALDLGVAPSATSGRLRVALGAGEPVSVALRSGIGSDLLREDGLSGARREPLDVRLSVAPLELDALMRGLSADARAPQLLAGRLRAEARLRGSWADPRLALTATVDDAVARGTALGRVRLALTAAQRARAAVADAEVRVAGQSLLRGRLSVPGRVAEVVRRGVAEAQHRGVLTIPGFRLGALSARNPELRARGRIAGSLHSTGSLARPSVSASLRASDLVLDGAPVGDASARLGLEPRELTAAAQLHQPGGGELRADFSAGRPGRVSGSLRVAGLDMRFVPGFDALDRPRMDALVRVDGAVHRASTGRLPGMLGDDLPDAELATELDIEVAHASLDLPLAPKGGEGKPSGERTEQGYTFDDTLRDLLPLRIRRLDVRNANLGLVTTDAPSAPTLALRDLSLTLENLATRRELLDGTPTVLGARARIAQGELVALAAIDPLAEKPTFAIQATARKLSLPAASEFVAAKLGLTAESGEFSARAVVRAQDGELRGAVKPVLLNPELDATGDTAASYLKAAAAELAELVLLDDVRGKDAEALLVPLRGSLDRPQIQVLPAVLKLIQDAMLAGLAGGAGDALPWQLPVREGLVQAGADPAPREIAAAAALRALHSRKESLP